MTRRARVSEAPLAVASDGTLVLNVAHILDSGDPKKLLERALAERGRLFVGVVASPKETKFVVEWLDDLFAEAAAWVWGGRQRRRRARRRIKRSTAS